MKAGILLAVIAAVGGILWGTGSFAPPARHLLITDVSAAPIAHGAVSAVLTIENQGAPDRLVSVSSPDGIAHFQNADRGLPVPVGKASLARDAAHIMVTPLDAALKDGALLPLTLTFEDAGEISVKARFAVPEPDSMAAHMAIGHETIQHRVTQVPFPAVRLTATETDEGWLAQVTTENFAFSEELQDGDHVPGVGHGHLYLGDMKLGRLFSDQYRIGALPRGQHTLRVSLNTNDHRLYVVDGVPVAAEAIIKVD